MTKNTKVVILAGGLGTRISEETTLKPKPMVEIGGKPILWHIMKIYSEQGFNDFIICLGYKGFYIKEWFSHYYLHRSDVTFDFEKNQTIFHNPKSEDWKVTLADTGEATMTGGRIKRIKDYIGDKTFMLTYGDGVSDVDINKLLKFHKRSKKIATMTSVIPEGRFGALKLMGSKVKNFAEKHDNKSRINAGFFVLEPAIFNYIEGDETVFEQEPLQRLAEEGQLVTFKHEGFWKAMDSLSDKNKLEAMWENCDAPWKTWE
ncbi:MAG: glucose-1-phosphate cytidylyltransferase [Patescibacteria group bacterium]